MGRPKKVVVPDVDATVSIEIEYGGETFSEAFTIKNVDGFMSKPRRNASCLYDDIMSGIRAKLGNNIG